MTTTTAQKLIAALAASLVARGYGAAESAHIAETSWRRYQSGLPVGSPLKIAR